MICYNIFNKTTGIDGRDSSVPGNMLSYYLGSRPKLCQSWDGYFLFFIFRIEMIKPAKAMIIINSSYVLMNYHPFRKTSGTNGSCPSQLPG